MSFLHSGLPTGNILSCPTLLTENPILCRTQPDSLKFIFCNGLALHRNQARATFGDWLNGIIELSRNLHAMELDVSSFSCLAALTLVNGEPWIDFVSLNAELETRDLSVI